MKALTQIYFFSGARNQHLKTLTSTLQIEIVSSIGSVILLKILQSGCGEQVFHTGRAYSCVCVCVCFLAVTQLEDVMSILRSPSSKIQCDYHQWRYDPVVLRVGEFKDRSKGRAAFQRFQFCTY